MHKVSYISWGHVARKMLRICRYVKRVPPEKRNDVILPMW